MNPYTALKPAWHREKIETLAGGGLIVPPHVQIILSDFCNHDCGFCAYRMSGGFSTELFADQDGNKNPKRMIEHEKAIEIIDDCNQLGVKAIQFTGGGEPTVHPSHAEIIRYTMDTGMEAALVTNGHVLRDDLLKQVPRLAWMRVSLDAGTPETYAKIRKVKPAVFGKVLNNIATLVQAIDENDSETMLGVSYVVTLDNWREILEATARVKATGAAYIRFAAMFGEEGSDYYKEWFDDIQAEIAAAKSEFVHNGFSVLDMFGGRVDDLKLGQPDYYHCGYQQFNVYIGGDLHIYRCCTTSYTKHGDIGSLEDQTFLDWFASKEREERLKGFNARSCHHCPFNDKNRAINYMIEELPLHVNFV